MLSWSDGHVWPFGRSEAEDIETAENVRDTYLEVGRPFFTQFLIFPRDFTRLTPETFASRKDGEFPPSSNEVKAFLNQAKIYHHLGHNDYVERFVEMGMANLGNTGLRDDFEALLKVNNARKDSV